MQLHANSNINTVVNSIDMIDKMHDSNDQITLGDGLAMMTIVCGVDLMIPDLIKQAEPFLNSWGVIQSNFNPMVMIHIFPYQRKS